MASVLFVIRVPYQENPTFAENEGGNESENSDESKKKETCSQLTGDDPSENAKKVNVSVANERTANEATPRKEAETSDDTNDADQTANDVEIFSFLDLAEVLQYELRSLNVQGDSWTVTKDNKFHQVVFMVKSGEKVEEILKRLIFVGIGKRSKSSVSIIPAPVHIQPEEIGNAALKRISQCQSTLDSVESETEPLLVERESVKEKFKTSIKSRLTVEQVVESVRAQASLTFDFVMFTILASLIAAVGLVEDNAVVLVASMLVSPLMGPILCGIFGAEIRNKNLLNTGLKTEVCGLILCVAVGFIFGLICAPFGLNGASWDKSIDIWPTKEMSSRGMTRSLWVGVLIALPSGAGVALSVLGGNTGSLVGVAISASLLPPAVNSGMLWAHSIVSAIKPPELLDSAEFNASTSKCPPFQDNSYMPTYSCDMGTEAAIMAIISLVLTVVNIICIFITATIVLKIKEVSPAASSSNATQAFWTKDIKVARESYQTFKGNHAVNFLKEWKKVNDLKRKGSRNSLLENEELLHLIKKAEDDDDYRGVVRQTSTGAQSLHKFSKSIKRYISKDDENPAEKEAEQLQCTLRNLQTLYTQRSKEKQRQPHVGTIFSEPGQPEPTKPEAEPSESEPNKPEPSKSEPVKPETEPTKLEPNQPEPAKLDPTQPEAEPSKLEPNVPTKSRNSVREFHVTDTEKPHHTAVVRIHPPTDDSRRWSITTESGV